MTMTVGIGTILATGVIAFGWGVLATHTAGAVATDAEAAIAGLTRPGSTRSNDVTYGLFSGSGANTRVLLVKDHQNTLSERDSSFPSSAYVPAAVVEKYPTPRERAYPPAHRIRQPCFTHRDTCYCFEWYRAPDSGEGEQAFAFIGLGILVVVSRLRWAGRCTMRSMSAVMRPPARTAHAAARRDRGLLAGATARRASNGRTAASNRWLLNVWQRRRPPAPASR